MVEHTDDHTEAHDAVLLAPEWTDRTWEQVWERTIGQVERRRLAMALLRREQPPDRLALRLLPELARRWRRTCLTLALGWGAFVVFWATIGWAAESGPDGVPVVTPWWMSLLGTGVVVICLALRRWIRDMAGPPPGS